VQQEEQEENEEEEFNKAIEREGTAWMVGRGMRLYVNAMKRKKYERVAMRKEFL
jgi:hypothetical protein